MKMIWLVAAGLTLLVALIGFAAYDTMQTRQHGADRYRSATRPEGADLYVEVEVQASKDGWKFTPERIETTKGQKVAIRLKNTDTVPHDLVLGPPYVARTNHLEPGQELWLQFTADKPGQIAFWCSVPGHRQSGMHGLLVVKERQ